MKLVFPEYIFSEKEIKDFKRREQVAEMLRARQSWKNIKETTGAHLQTIAIISKRLKKVKPAGIGTTNNMTVGNKRTIFVFGRSE